MYRKARNAAKTYDKTVENQQKAKDKDGYKLTIDQKEKVKNLENYKRSVLESIETLALFEKHYQKTGKNNADIDDDFSEDDDNEGNHGFEGGSYDDYDRYLESKPKVDTKKIYKKKEPKSAEPAVSSEE